MAREGLGARVASRQDSVSARWAAIIGQPSGQRRTSGVPGVTGTGDCARIAARVKAAAPLPLIRRRRLSRSLDDHADADAGIVDVPGHGPVINALAGEGGHAPLKRGPIGAI
jgi:hypothetical protein